MSEGRQVLLVLSVVAAGMILLAATVWGWIAVTRQLAFEVRSPAPNVAADQKGSVPDPPSRPKPAGFRRRETLAERQADLRRGLDERRPDEPLFGEVSEFLTLVSASRSDSVRTRGFLDRQRFHQEVSECGTDIPDADELWLQVALPGGDATTTVLHVQPLSSHECRVIAVTDEAGTLETERWWLTRQSGTWKVYDWDDSKIGLRLSEFHAQHAPLEMLEAPCPLHQISEICDRLEQLTDEGTPGWETEVRRLVLEMVPALQSIPYPLVEWKRHHVSTVARYASSYDELKVVRMSPQPVAHPYITLAEARARSGAGDHAGAVEYYESYLEQIGECLTGRKELARALWQSGHPEQALPHWRRVVRVRPRDVESLAGLYRDGTADRDRPLVVQMLRDLSETELLQLGYSLSIHDPTVGRSFVEECERQLGRTAAVFELIGDRHEWEGRLDEAADAYGSSMASSGPSPTEERSSKYYAAMIRSNRAADAYRAASDRAAAFQALIAELDPDETEFSGRDLIAARLEEAPDDAQALKLAAILAERGGRHSAAEQLWKHLIEATGSAETSDHAFARRGYARCLAAQDQWEEADAACSSEEEHRHLAESMSRLQDWDHLSDALERWKERYPQSAWVHATMAELMEQDGRFEMALKSLRQAYSLSSEPERSRYRSRWSRLQLEQGRIQNAWYEIKPLNDSLNDVCEILLEDGNVDDLENLLTASKPNPQNQPAWHYWAPQYHFDGMQYPGVLNAFSCKCSASLRGEKRIEIEDLMLRAALRLGDGKRADDIFRRNPRQGADPFWRILADVRSGQTAAVLQRFHQEEFPDVWSEMYLDEEAGPLLTAPEYREIRERHPPWVACYDVPEESEIVLILDRPFVASAEDLQKGVKRISEHLEPTVTELDATGHEFAAKCYLLHTSVGDVIVSCGDSTAFTFSDRDQWGVADKTIGKWLSQHQGWISIRPVTRIVENRPRYLSTLRSLAVVVFGAVRQRVVWYDATFDLAVTASKLPLNRTELNFLSSVWRRAGTSVSLDLGSTDPDRLAPPIPPEEVLKKWKALSKGESLVADVSVGHWTRREHVPVRIEALLATDRGWSIRGRAMKDSLVQPALKSGMPLRLSPPNLVRLEIVPEPPPSK